MGLDPAHPDLAITLRLDSHAPRAARHHVAQVDRPSPDLRDAVVLLSSELVTHAVERSPGATIELRAWMPPDVVRIELHGSPDVVDPLPGEQRTYSSLLLDQLADRWSVETSGATPRLWFEIDRHQAPLIAAERPERNAGALQW
jgi:hypothetical protein